MFRPKYNLSKILLDNIVRIKNIVQELNEQRFSDLVLAEFEKDGYAVSAFASTSIEGNPLPLTDVKRLLKQNPSVVRDTEKEVLNYNKALHHLNEEIKRNVEVTNDFICGIQKIVVEGLLDKKNTGKFRNQPVVVNDPKKRQVVYMPPNVEDVSRLMRELTQFLNTESSSLDPLILAGIFHKQFVIVHPFMDGNGRTTRLVTKFLLAKMGLDTFKLFSFENYYNKNVTKYFSSVGVYGDYYEIEGKIDFTGWLEYFTGGIIDELLRVQRLLQNTQVTEMMRLPEHEKIILDYIKTHGSISKGEYARITNRARSTQILDFKKLLDKGMIVRFNKSKSTYYVLGDILTDDTKIAQYGKSFDFLKDEPNTYKK